MSAVKPNVHLSPPRVKDPVTLDRIHKEALAEEKRTEKIYQNFQINSPQKLTIFTDKPNNNKFLLMKLHDEGKTLNGVDLDEALNKQLAASQLPGHITNKLTTMNQIPKDKYMFPQTSNQQFGWHTLNNNLSNSGFSYGRKICKETTYADDYYTMKHYSPFSNKNKQ